MNIKELIGELREEELSIKNDYYNETFKLVNTLECNWDGNYEDGQHYIPILVEDFNKAFVFSLARKLKNIRANITDRYCGDNPIRGEVLGVMAEAVVSRAYKSDFDVSTEPRKGGADTTIDGKRIDVKICMPSRNDNDSVVVSESKAVEDCDYYFFTRMLVDNKGGKYLNIYGYASSDAVVRDENKIEGRRGYWLKKEHLTPFTAVLEVN